MKSERGEIAVLGAGIAYLALLGWAVGNVSYDVWGVLIVVPIYGLLGFLLMRRMFRDSGRGVANAMCWGLVIKLGGAGARYWVGFETYDGAIDAARYHNYAIAASGEFWSGGADLWSVLPGGTGTEFLERFTAFVYTFTGGSQLAGFVTFAFLAYLGTALLVKAAIIAVPKLAARRYAWLCVIAPSLVYWPASIGKEAVVLLGIGLAAYGLASFLSTGRLIWPMIVASLGLGIVSAVRIHIAGLVVAAMLPGLAVALLRRSSHEENQTGTRRQANKFGVVVVLLIAAISLTAIAGATVRFLSPGDVDGESGNSGDTVTQILEETSRRTTKQGSGSTFEPPSVSSPANWPYASLRTLTRPLPSEARGGAALFSAAEMMLLVGLYAIYRRNLANLPRLVLGNGYVLFAVALLFLGGLAYSSFGNMGVLARQKSLLFPFLLLLPCLPVRTRREIPDVVTPSGNVEGGRVRSAALTGRALPTDAAPSSRSSRRSDDDDLWS